MQVIGVLLQPEDWQRAVGYAPIDPMGVSFDPLKDYPVYIDFSAVMPCGTARVERSGNGGLFVTATLYDYMDLVIDGDYCKFAVGVKHPPRENDWDVVSNSTLVCIGLCDRLSDENQPAAEVIE